MSHLDLDTAPAPRRFPFCLSERCSVVALLPVLGVVILGFFLNGSCST